MKVTIDDTDPTDPNSNAAIMAAIQEMRKDMGAHTDAINALKTSVDSLGSKVDTLAGKEVVTPEDTAALAEIKTGVDAIASKVDAFVGAAPTPPAGA